jgi:hypothetical protein
LSDLSLKNSPEQNQIFRLLDFLTYEAGLLLGLGKYLDLQPALLGHHEGQDEHQDVVRIVQLAQLHGPVLEEGIGPGGWPEQDLQIGPLDVQSTWQIYYQTDQMLPRADL